jgi:excisionase family DNA binding protein
VAERLQVSDDTVYRLIAAGHLQTVPHLPKKRIPQEALDRFMRGEA